MKKRIASILASGTEIVAALGLEDRLVAISHQCDHPPRVLDRPRVSRPRIDPGGLDSGGVDRAVRAAIAEHGSVYEVDGDALERLRPDLVLTQAVCEVCAVPAPGVERIVRDRGLDAEVLSLDAHTLGEILDSVRTVGEAAGVPDRATGLVDRLQGRIDAVRRTVAGEERPRVLALEWLDPPFVPGHWVPEMVEAAGGENLAGRPGEPSAATRWEALAGLDPDALVVLPCGYGVEAAARDADRASGRLREVAPRAIAEGRAWVVDGSSHFSRSGPRTVRGVEILAALLHPEIFEEPPPGEARPWRPPGS